MIIQSRMRVNPQSYQGDDGAHAMTIQANLQVNEQSNNVIVICKPIVTSMKIGRKGRNFVLESASPEFWSHIQGDMELRDGNFHLRLFPGSTMLGAVPTAPNADVTNVFHWCKECQEEWMNDMSTKSRIPRMWSLVNLEGVEPLWYGSLNVPSSKYVKIERGTFHLLTEVTGNERERISKSNKTAVKLALIPNTDVMQLAPPGLRDMYYSVQSIIGQRDPAGIRFKRLCGHDGDRAYWCATAKDARFLAGEVVNLLAVNGGLCASRMDAGYDQGQLYAHAVVADPYDDLHGAPKPIDYGTFGGTQGDDDVIAVTVLGCVWARVTGKGITPNTAVVAYKSGVKAFSPDDCTRAIVGTVRKYHFLFFFLITHGG
jgi:hypothetical protein